MGKHRDTMGRPEVLRALAVLGIVVVSAALVFGGLSAVKAWQAYRQVER
jgi:hypothetical protein